METLCRLHVKEGSLFQLVCPDNKCKDSIPPYILKRLLTEAEYERWDRLLLQKTLDSMPNVVYCPNCVIGCMEDEDNHAQCPKCSFIFCSFCKGPCHTGKKCLSPEERIQRRKVYIKDPWFVVCSLFSIPERRSMLWFYWKRLVYRLQAGWLRKRWRKKCSTSDNCTRMFGCAQNAEWPSPKQKGATKWCVETVASSSALPAARPSVVISISGRTFGHPVSLFLSETQGKSSRFSGLLMFTQTQVHFWHDVHVAQPMHSISMKTTTHCIAGIRTANSLRRET